jgi:uncharacterized membrane protein
MEMMYWIPMLFILPVILILFGILFIKRPPKKVNAIYGYRTDMSMKNMDTWQFAHAYCGRLWLIAGLALLPLSAGALLFILLNETGAGLLGAFCMIVQLVVMIIPIIFTEKALRRSFDAQGRRLTGKNPIK